MNDGKNTTNVQPPKPTQPSNVITLGEPITTSTQTTQQPSKPNHPSNVVTKSNNT